MKKIILLLLSGCLLLTACGPGMAEPAAAARVVPLPPAVDPHNLDNCTVHVSLREGDAYVDGTGAMQMKLTVCAFDLYDMAEVSLLKEGDFIVIRGMDVAVRTLESLENGGFAINGGYRSGGFTLYPEDGGTLFEVGPGDARFYQTLGQATVRVSPDFVYTDSADPDRGDVTYYAGDFLTEGTGIDYDFVPSSTIVRIENGFAVSMHRIYTP